MSTPASSRAFVLSEARDAPIDDATWDRAALWGLHFALLYLGHAVDSPRFGRMGHRLLRALCV